MASQPELRPPPPAERSTADLMYRMLALPVGEWRLRMEAPLRLGASEVVPDLAIVPGRVEDYAAQHPTTTLLIIEIAATSPQRDR